MTQKITAQIALILLGILSFSSFAFSQDYPRYTINAVIDTNKKEIKAAQKVSFTNNTKLPTSEIDFHIYPNRKYTPEEQNFMWSYAGYFKINPFPKGFDSGHITINAVTQNDQPLNFMITGKDETLLVVPLAKPLFPNETIELNLNFSVNIPVAYGRFGTINNVTALSRWYPILCVLTDKGWNKNPFYPFHRPFFSESAYYKVNLTVPSNQVVIFSGQLQKETEGADSKKTLSLETAFPIRDFSLSLSPDYKKEELKFGDIKINSFYLPGDEAHAKLAAQDARDLMEMYTKRFRAYPYGEFNIAPVYLGYGGEQMSNMIFIDTRVFQLPRMLDRYFDFLIAHETGHQWFYNMVGADEYTEMWLEEGIDSFFLLDYLEGKYGKNATIAVLPKELNFFLPNVSFRETGDYRYQILARTNFDQPITSELSHFIEPLSIFSLTYGKGSRIVSMLRDVIGQEAFDKAFKRIFEEYRFQNITIALLEKFCEEESHKDLKWFFNQWLYTDKKYDAAVTGVHNDTVTFKNRGEIRMSVEVNIQLHNGDKKQILWDGQKDQEEIKVESSSRIKNVQLDPEQKLLDIDKTNNNWPRKINTKLVPLYLPLYDIPLFLPQDSYNVVAGPEFANSGIGLKASIQKPFDQIAYAASDYEFSKDLAHSRLGYQLNYVGNSLRTLGFELFNTTDLKGGEEDLAGGMVYLRQELNAASYGLTDINNHVTLYLMRDRSLNNGLSLTEREDSQNTSYLRKDEAIIGTALHLGQYGPYPDPSQGYKADTLFESSGHFLGATQYFYRGSLDTAFYKPLWAQSSSKLVLRLKYGWGYPTDKNLYELGGMDGLRGYNRKTLRGSNMGLGSLEFRFPMIKKLDVRVFDNLINLESMNGVVFADLGQSWYGNIDDTQFKKDAGLGLRFVVTLGSFLEKVIVRLDAAQAIDEPKEPTRFWFGLGHAF